MLQGVTFGRHWFSCLSVSSSSCFIACTHNTITMHASHTTCARATAHATAHATARACASTNLRARLDVDACDAGAEGGVHGHVVTAAARDVKAGGGVCEGRVGVRCMRLYAPEQDVAAAVLRALQPQARGRAGEQHTVAPGWGARLAAGVVHERAWVVPDQSVTNNHSGSVPGSYLYDGANKSGASLKCWNTSGLSGICCRSCRARDKWTGRQLHSARQLPGPCTAAPPSRPLPPSPVSPPCRPLSCSLGPPAKT
jgi:hypothetical protein